MEVDTAECSGSAVLEDVGVGLSQERQTGGEQFVGLWREVILIVDVRLRHIEHLLAVLINGVVALLVLEINLQVTVVGQFRVQTVFQHGEGSIGIAHAVDGLCQVEPYRGVAVEIDIGCRRLEGIDVGGVGPFAHHHDRGACIAEWCILHDPVEGCHLHLLGEIVVLRTAGRVDIDLRRHNLDVLCLGTTEDFAASHLHRILRVGAIVVIAEGCRHVRGLTHRIVHRHRDVGDDIARRRPVRKSILPNRHLIEKRTVLGIVIIDGPLSEVLEDRTVLAREGSQGIVVVDGDITRIDESRIAQILIVARGSLLILAQFEIDITQHDVEGDEALAGVDELINILTTVVLPVESADGARCLSEGGHRQLLVAIAGLEAFEHLGLSLKDGIIARHRGVGIDLGNGGDRLGDVRHITVLSGELQIGPCTERGDGGILVAHHIAGTRGQRGVTMGQIIVTVVDDLVIKVHAVVLVGGIGRERSQVAQMQRGLAGRLHQIATQFILEEILVGQLLHSLHDTIGIEHGVGLLVERRIEQLTRTIRLQHVAARGKE